MDATWKATADEHGVVFTGDLQGHAAPDDADVPSVQRTDVMIHRLDILPHPNADALELAVVGGAEQCLDASGCAGCSCGREDVGPHCSEHIRTIVGGFRAVVLKGVYKTGDYALYIPEASVLPEALIEELGLVGRLSGSGKNRVKAVRLRGELSQGIVCRPELLKYVFHNLGNFNQEGILSWQDYLFEIQNENFAEMLGIEKWAPRMPAHFRGKVRPRGTSRILPWIEIPNIKKVMGDFTPGELVVATEKIHGTHCMITWDKLGNDGAGELLVSSKGIGKQGWDLVEDSTNVYWRAVRKHNVENLLRWIAEQIPYGERFALYGEVYGRGIQDMEYGETDIAFVAFDLRIDYMWCNTDVFYNIIAASLGVDHDVCLVPEVYRGAYDYDRLRQLAEGRTRMLPDDGPIWHIREGLVVRPAVERFNGNARVIAKFISEAYLLRKGYATEFE